MRRKKKETLKSKEGEILKSQVSGEEDSNELDKEEIDELV